MSESFRRFLDSLQEAIEWCDSIGIRLSTSRFAEYVDTVERELIKIKDPPSKSDLIVFHTALTAIEAGSELILIKRALSNLVSPELVSRLKQYVGGTTLEVSESHLNKTHHPRNFGFELVLAAQLADGGLPVEFPPNGDILIKIPYIQIECKRLQSENNISGAFKKAVRQLALRKPVGQYTTNIVAISVGKVIHRGEYFLTAPDNINIDKGLFSILNNFRLKHAYIWDQRPLKHVQAVLLHISTNIHVTANNTWLWGTYAILNQLNHNCSDGQERELKSVAVALKSIAATGKY
jgi:hypothetical protein